MKNIIAFFIVLILLVACEPEKKNFSFKTSDSLIQTSNTSLQTCDTVIAAFMSCTECSDLYIYQGKLSSGGEPDIRITGNFPMGLIDMTSVQYDPLLMFRIIGTSTKKKEERLPVFDVESYDKFYFEHRVWQDTTAAEVYQERSKMVDGLLNYFKFKGEHINFYLYFLGKPDFCKSNSIEYKLDERDILEIGFSNDSIISHAGLKK